MIPDSAIAEVKERADVVKVVGRAVALRKAGTIYKGLCPFHDEKTPSFTVSPTRNTYHCFGCGVHGDSIRFLMEHGARSFPDAVRELAAEVGVEIVEDRNESPDARAERLRVRSERELLLAAQDKLTAWYSDVLASPRGRPAQVYLEERDISREAAQAFRLGWASGDKRAFAEFIEQSGIGIPLLVKLGVVIEPDEGWNRARPIDGGRLRFRERLMFPVVDIRGEVTGYSGRILDPHKKTAKYLNSPETPVFTKGQQLYGAYTARNEARRAGRLVLCEGNVDVIALWQAGFRGTVAAMGTALTAQQVRLSKRICDQIVCVMDGDAAGAKAAYASLVPFLEAGVQPRAVMLADGDDPDAFVRREGAEAFAARLDAAPPLLDAFVEHVARRHPEDAPGRAAALRDLAPALNKLEDPVTLQLYQHQIAARLEMAAEIVEAAIRQADNDEKRSARPDRNARPARRSEPEPSPAAAFETAPIPFEVPIEAYGEPPPPLENAPFFDSAGFEPVIERRRIRRRRSPDYVSRYVKEVFVFIMQYPRLSVPLMAHPGYNCLTRPALADFVARLCGEVDGKQSAPNVDRVLDEFREDKDLIAFLRGCETRRSQDDKALNRSFENALLIMETQHYRAERRRVLGELRTALAAGDRDEIESLTAEKSRIQDAVLRLEREQRDGAQ